MLYFKEIEKLKVSIRELRRHEERFYVNTAKCRMPYVEPFNAEVMKVYKPMTFVSCTNKSDLVTVHYDSVFNQYVLHINEEVIHKETQSEGNAIACFYQKIIYGRKVDVYDR